MLKRYKNILFDEIQSNGFDLKAFEFFDPVSDQHMDGQDLGIGTSQFLPGPECTKIEHKESMFNFQIQSKYDSFDHFKCCSTLFKPNFPNSIWIPSKQYEYVDFGGIVKWFNEWINDDLKRFLEEQTTIDLWEEYKKSNKTLGLNKITFDEKTNFTIDERASVKLGLNNLKLLIQEEFKTTKERQLLVEEHLDYLIEATNRLNKFDWKGVAVNTIISITIALTLSPEQGNRLFQLFAKVLSFIPALGSGN